MRDFRLINSQLAERYRRWLIAQRYAPQTKYSYGRSIDSFIAFLNSRPVLKTTHLDVQEFLARCAEQGRAAKAVRGELYAIRVFFDFLNLGALIKWVAPQMVKLRRIPRPLPRVFSTGRLGRIRHKLHAVPHRPRFRYTP